MRNTIAVASLLICLPQSLLVAQSIDFDCARAYPFSFEHRADYDGDGLADGLVAGGGLLRLHSGVDGRNYEPTVTSPIARYPSAHGDIDGDGDIDLIALTPSPASQIQVLANDGNGAFTALPPLPGSYESGGMWLVDLDLDGDLDLIAKREETPAQPGGWFSFLLGDGLGGFVTAQEFPLPAGASMILFPDGDHNGDGFPDPVGVSAWTTVILLSNGALGHSPPVAVPGLASPTDQADIDLDGDLDLVGSALGADAIAFLLGDGTGLGWTSTLLPGFVSPVARVGDLDEDGILDLAFRHGSYTGAIQSFEVRLGAGFPAYVPHFSSSGTYGWLKLEDYDADGHLDLDIVQCGVSIFYGDGTGTFPTDTGHPLAGAEPITLDTGDLNGDGSADAVVLDGFGANTSVEILLSDPSGQFTSVGSISPAGTLLRLADLDGDGDLDLITGQYSIAVHWGDGAGGFLPGPSLVGAAAGGYSQDVAIADFDGDGFLDLATSFAGYISIPGSVVVHRGIGGGGFLFVADTPLIAGAEEIEAVDIDHDGHVDLITTHSPTARIGVQWGVGDATFLPAQYQYLPPGAFPNRTLAVGDLDGDGESDIALGTGLYLQTSLVGVLFGDGMGGFGSGVTVTGPGPSRRVSISDLDGNGEPDLLTGGGVGVFGGCSIEMFRRDVPRAFRSAGAFAAGSKVIDFDLVDFEGDGDLDILAIASPEFSSLPDRLVVLRNTSVAPAFHRGDCNGDASLDLADPISGLMMLLGAASALPCVDSCDVNDDGAFDIADPIALLAWLFILGTPPPPAPATTCGADPTSDSLPCPGDWGC